MEPSNLCTREHSQLVSVSAGSRDPRPCVCQTAYLKEELSASQIISQNIQHAYHLGEDEDSVSSLLQTDQQLVQQYQLPTAADQMLREEKQGL